MTNDGDIDGRQFYAHLRADYWLPICGVWQFCGCVLLTHGVSVCLMCVVNPWCVCVSVLCSSAGEASHLRLVTVDGRRGSNDQPTQGLRRNRQTDETDQQVSFTITGRHRPAGQLVVTVHWVIEKLIHVWNSHLFPVLVASLFRTHNVVNYRTC